MWRYRFDYLARDSMHLSIKLGCDFSRILNFSKARMLQHCPSLLAFHVMVSCWFRGRSVNRRHDHHNATSQGKVTSWA